MQSAYLKRLLPHGILKNQHPFNYLSINHMSTNSFFQAVLKVLQSQSLVNTNCVHSCQQKFIFFFYRTTRNPVINQWNVAFHSRRLKLFQKRIPSVEISTVKTRPGLFRFYCHINDFTLRYMLYISNITNHRFDNGFIQPKTYPTFQLHKD